MGFNIYGWGIAEYISWSLLLVILVKSSLVGSLEWDNLWNIFLELINYSFWNFVIWLRFLFLRLIVVLIFCFRYFSSSMITFFGILFCWKSWRLDENSWFIFRIYYLLNVTHQETHILSNINVLTYKKERNKKGN